MEWSHRRSYGRWCVAIQGFDGISSFWDDEFNFDTFLEGESDESVQAKYIPRGILYNHAAGVKTYVWLLTTGVDANEYDDFGFIHAGSAICPDDFTPRPVYYAYQNTNALFADTKVDAGIVIEPSEVPPLRGSEFLRYGFRNKNGKAIVAYWVAAHSNPGGAFAPLTVSLTLKGSGIQKPVLIDVVSGEILPLSFKGEMVEGLPLRDSVMAIADASYFDWAVLPEAPSGLRAYPIEDRGRIVLVECQSHAGTVSVTIERRVGIGRWQRLGNSSPGAVFTDSDASPSACYRARAANGAGESAYSNVACANSPMKSELRRVLRLRDLIFYGIVMIQPTAPMPLFGVASQEARGHVVTTILAAMVGMALTAVSYGKLARV